MYWVYALYSSKFDKIYIGYTKNLAKRFESHNRLAKKGFTVRYRPWKIVHSENFQTKKEAIRRERQLKSSSGRKYVWEVINKSSGG